MTVHFIGAGPGSADLLTLRAKKLILRSPVCIYAGSLIPKEILEYCPKNAKIINSAKLSLDQIMHEIVTEHRKGKDISRLHSGDLSVWSAMGEQIQRIKAEKIKFSITPGVPSFAAAAAALEKELTLPYLSQSVILTRISGRASSVPESEKLEYFARTEAVLAIHLSVHRLSEIVDVLIPYYGKSCPVAIVWRASWPDQKIITKTLNYFINFENNILDRTAIIFVGKTLGDSKVRESSLYSINYDRRFRPTGSNPRFPDESN